MRDVPRSQPPSTGLSSDEKEGEEDAWEQVQKRISAQMYQREVAEKERERRAKKSAPEHWFVF